MGLQQDIALQFEPADKVEPVAAKAAVSAAELAAAKVVDKAAEYKAASSA